MQLNLLTMLTSNTIQLISRTPLPEHFLLLALQPAGQQSIVVVTSALLRSLLICDGFRCRGGQKD